MKRKLKDKLTYANVVSTLCLFVLLGGSAYAALKVPRNSVGTRQLKAKSVTNGKLANERGDRRQNRRRHDHRPKRQPGRSGHRPSGCQRGQCAPKRQSSAATPPPAPPTPS